MRPRVIQLARAVTAALVASLLLIAFPISATSASPPSLVRDINPQGSSNPSSLTRVGETLFFSANDNVHGKELWKTDGTAAGTRMVKNIRPKAKGSAPQNLIDVNGTLFFTANDGQHGREWWTSDGTAAGTRLVTDLIPVDPDSNAGGDLRITLPPVAVSSRLFFFDEQCCFSTPSLLYVTDGTAAGTRLLSDPDADSDIPYWSTATAFNRKLYFVSRDFDDGLDRLWVSNGTPAGTKQLAWSPAADEMYIVPATGENLYFSTVRVVPNDDLVFRLWKTNGTAAGTRALTSAGELDGAASEAVYMAGRLYFNAGALWKTNGTPRGTREILDQPVHFLAAAGGRLYFSSAVFGEGMQLWSSNGTPSGTAPVMGFGDYMAPRQLVAVGDEVCFVILDWNANTWHLWASDGTAAGTHQAASFVDPVATSADGPLGTAIGSTLYFRADDGTHGVELWRYNP